MRSVSLSNACDSCYGMGKKIDNIILVRRTSEYGRDNRPEPARPPLKTRGKMEAVFISQQRSRHGNSQRVGVIWFIAEAVRNDDRGVASLGRIHFAKHIIPSVRRGGGFGQTNELKPGGRAKLIREARGESLCYAGITTNEHFFQT